MEMVPILRRVMLADQLSGVVITIQYLSAAAVRVRVFELCDITGVAGYH
jgi:hypothetical protein